MANWTCGSCGTMNGPNNPACEVCGVGRTNSPAQPLAVVPVATMASADRVSEPTAGPNQAATSKGPGSGGPASPASDRSGGSSKLVRIGVLAVAAVLLVALGVGIASLRSPSDDTASNAVASPQKDENSGAETPTTDAPPGIDEETAGRGVEAEADPVPIEGDPPDTVPAAPPAIAWGPFGDITPLEVRASCQSPPGEDAQGVTQTYEPRRATDGDPETTWRCDGDAVGDTLTLTFDEPVRVTEVSVIPGFAKVDPLDGADRFQQNRRIAAARILTDGASTAVTYRTDDRSMQPTAMDEVTTTVEIVVDRTVPGSRVQNRDGAVLEPRDVTPISEVVVRGHRPT